MPPNFNALPRTTIQVDAAARRGLFQSWRHSVGQGGVNSLPLPDRVGQGLAKLKPRLVRVFLQEYFNVYPDHGVYHWDKLDAYLDSFDRAGVKVLATINLKPPPLFPELNHDLWKPSDVGEWQELLYRMARRYSVEKPIVTHWEHVNEADIGEWGGCPYHITAPENLHAFYVMNIDPILRAFPAAKVGGPCSAGYEAVFPFVDLCAERGTPLDFVSYHRYDDDAETHRRVADELHTHLLQFPTRPELMINEWNKGFEPHWSGGAYDSVSVEEMALLPRRAALVARTLLHMMHSGLDWSFYYLLWDNVMLHDEFRTFFSPEGARDIMYKHWNEAPHRFGLFSESGRARPQYFVYQMLSRMDGWTVECDCAAPDLTLTGSNDGQTITVMVVNLDPNASRDQLVKLQFSNLPPGLRMISAYRIDESCRWSDDDLELLPTERRRVDVLGDFECQFYSPADSVLWVRLEPARLEPMRSEPDRMEAA